MSNLNRGFTLLEVMIALALLAVSFTILLLVQTRSTDLALQARNLSIATELARLQLVECKQEAQKIIASASDWKKEGDFSEQGYENFKWECHAPKFNMKTPSQSQLEESVKKRSPDDKKAGMQNSASTMSPILSLVSESLGGAVRELAVIVRWKEGDVDEEMRVVTHIVDLAPISVLGKMLKQGSQSLRKSGDDKKDSKDDAVNPAGRGGPGMPPPHMRGRGMMPPMMPGMPGMPGGQRGAMPPMMPGQNRGMPPMMNPGMRGNMAWPLVVPNPSEVLRQRRGAYP